jgi:hypothetical protein
MKKSNAGAKTVMTKDTLQLLRESFSWGCTDSEACCYADISTSTLYNYCKDNPEFLELKNKLKDSPTMKAKRIINGALDEADLNTAHRVIDRKEGSKVKQEISGPNGEAIKSVVEWSILPVTPINKVDDETNA